ncbi:MAG: lysoplasmalogenase [Actinomycetia bacterium]|nr:lysoplasmalogenase [Actinomycetes bacterium]
MDSTLMYALAGLVFAVGAGLNWFAMLRARPRLGVLSKPFPLLALIAIALLAGAASQAPGRLLLLGLVLCLAGDVLIGESEPRFLAGLAAFLLGHLAYVLTFSTLRLSEPAWALIGVMVLIGCLLVIRRVLPSAHESGGAGLVVAIVAYVLVIGAMVVTAWMTGEWLIGLGATTFAVSDSILAVNRFVRRHRLADLAVMVTYYLGQALITVGVLAALR